MKTEPARHAEAFEFGFKVTRPALMSSDAATSRLAAEVAAIKTKIATPPPIRDSLAAEIRTAIRSAPPSERMKMIMRAIKDGDYQIPAACIGGPSLLSGLKETDLAHVRATYSTARYPAEVKRIATLEAASTHLERAAKLALDYSLSVADRSIVDKAKASAQRAAEAIAEANRPLLNWESDRHE